MPPTRVGGSGGALARLLEGTKNLRPVSPAVPAPGDGPGLAHEVPSAHEVPTSVGVLQITEIVIKSYQ